MASEETPASAPASTEGVSSPPAATPVPAPASTPTAAAAAAAAEAPAAASSSSTAEAPNAAASSSKTAASKPKAKAKASGAKNYSTDPALYIYTSLTAGNMHIVTATSRLETILRANRVPFKATDLATDEKARMLWGRRAGKTAEGKPRRLPALVQMGLVLGVCVSASGFVPCLPVLPYCHETNPPYSMATRISPRSKNGTNSAS